MSFKFLSVLAARSSLGEVQCMFRPNKYSSFHIRTTCWPGGELGSRLTLWVVVVSSACSSWTFQSLKSQWWEYLAQDRASPTNELPSPEVGIPAHSCLRVSSIKVPSGTGEMAQQLRALAALTEDQGSIPSTHLKWLTTTCYCSPRDHSLLPSVGTTYMLHSNTHI